MNDTVAIPALTPQDFTSDQEVRWCPGCGDYAIIKAVRKALADIGTDTKDVVFVSGIGCAARFPYYMATYGFHTIHGRAPAIATGVKLANPNLDVWVVSGDGDGLSIGGNHTLHALRRNVDLNILLFNNEIYGLTKGQYSPTSREGTRSPSTPLGSVDHPLSATRFALGAGARFVARAIDTDQKRLPDILKAAHGHKGTSFVEIFQNCIVYNDGAFDAFAERKNAAETQIFLEHGKPLVFGKERERGLRLAPGSFALEAVTLGEGGVDEGRPPGPRPDQPPARRHSRGDGAARLPRGPRRAFLQSGTELRGRGLRADRGGQGRRQGGLPRYRDRGPVAERPYVDGRGALIAPRSTPATAA